MSMSAPLVYKRCHNANLLNTRSSILSTNRTQAADIPWDTQQRCNWAPLKSLKSSSTHSKFRSSVTDRWPALHRRPLADQQSTTIM